MWQIIHAAVRETLAKTGAVPPMDFDREGGVEIPVLERGAVYTEPRAMSDESYNPFNEEYVDPSAPDPNVDFTGFDVPFHDGPSAVSDTAAPGFGAAAGGRRSWSGGGAFRDFGDPGFSGGGFSLPAAGGETFEEFVSDAVREEPAGASALEFIPSAGNAEQQRLEIDADPGFTDPLPVAGGYVAALRGGRLTVVDVRRARERILYEDYLRMLSNGSSVSQQLLFPERLELSGDEYALLEENAVDVAALGFDIDYAGGGVIEVKGAPADLPADAIDKMLYELLQAFAMPVSLGDVRREKIALAMARGAARGPMRTLSREEAAALLSQLAETGNIAYSPSGKAVFAEILPEDMRAKLG